MYSAHAYLLLGLVALGVGGYHRATAQTSPTPDLPNTTTLAAVHVTGSTNAAQVRYSDLLAGVAAFHRYRHYAPRATLLFYLGPQAQVAASPPVTLEMQTTNDQINVPVATDGQFVLPAEKDVGGRDGYLVANRPEGAVGIGAIVRSDADSDRVLRLGDLRLQCEADWAIEKQNVPKSVRSLFYLAGRTCHSSKIAVNYFRAPHDLRTAILSYGDRQVPLLIRNDKRTYWPPLGDKTWPDDAMVTLIFADAAQTTAGP